MRTFIRIGICAIVLIAALGANRSRPIRLTRPWSQLANLTNEQKAKIDEIHHHARAEIKVILQRERRQCMSVLTQAQLNQLRDIEDQKTVDRKLAATQAISN